MGNQGDPLAELRDIHLPEAISIWPLAPGWWLLILLTTVGLGISLALWLRYHRSRLYRRQALQQLMRIKVSGSVEASALMALLKQTVDTAYPQRGYSSLSLQKFLQLLEHSCPGTQFIQSKVDLEAALYTSQATLDAAEAQRLLESAKLWITRHLSSSKLEYPSPC